jgi:hypothetical protein
MDLSNYRTTSNEILYKDELTEQNKIVGIVLPTCTPKEAFEKFLVGLPNMTNISSISTILFNFQRWTDDQIRDAINICHANNFKVIYSKNEYITDKGIPFNLIMEDTAQLMPEAIIYLSMDDDIKVLHASPKIQKSGGRQYLECIHYLMNYEKCGLVTTTGTIGKIPPRNYLGPNYKRNILLYIMTGLGLFLRNIHRDDPSKGLLLPPDSLDIYGALGDLLAGAFRLSNGYYSAKYNHVRAKHDIATRSFDETQSTSDYGWDKSDVIDNGVAKYIRDHWSPEFNYKSTTQYSVTYDYYTQQGGLDIWTESSAKQLIAYYPQDSTRLSDQQLLDEIIREATRMTGDAE